VGASVGYSTDLVIERDTISLFSLCILTNTGVSEADSAPPEWTNYSRRVYGR